MKLRSLIVPQIENFEVKLSLGDVKRIMDNGQKRFHFRWLNEKSFVISSNFSFGSNLLFDTNQSNTKSDIVFYGSLSEQKESNTQIILRTKSKYLLATLMVVLPLLILIFQSLIKTDFPIFLVAFLLFPLLIFAVLNLIRSEENKLLGMFKKLLNNELN